MSVWTQTPIPFPSEVEVARILALPTPPPSPLTPLSSPLPQIPSPPLPLPSPPTHTSPTYAEAPLGYRAAGIQLRAASPLPLPAPSTSRRADIPEADIPPRKRLCLTALTRRFEVGESSAAGATRQPGSTVARRVDYSFVDTVDASIRDTERRTMDAIERDRAALRDEVDTLRRRIATSGSVKMPMIMRLEPSCVSRHWRLEHALILWRTLGVADALAERDADRSRNGDDCHDSGSDRRRRMPVTRECTYSDFLKCQPLNFKGTEGVVGLTQWFEKIESVFHISNCTVACQIKFATCTLQGNALTWWNSHVKTVTHEVAYAMTWKTLKKMMTDKYCPRGEIKKLEIEMWNLKVKGTDVVSYNQRFQELSLMCSRMFPEESDEIEKYVGGPPDMIHGSVMASKPKTMQDAIEFATELMDQKIRTLAERQAENKRKF
ncbi:reverse transcriptase domain-containing protein, partial [Tanacetum coccineum]